MSCNDNGWLWQDPELDITIQEQGKSNLFKGGNVECEQIGSVLGIENLTFPYSFKNDFNGSNFKIPWSELIPGIEVRVDGNKVDWWTNGNIQIGTDCYKVGAAILKSSTWSNIYYYGSGGAIMDKGLLTYTGQALSNLTFCLVRCENQPQLVIAAKAYITTVGQWDWAVSGGTGSSSNSLFIGYNNYVSNTTNVYPLNYMYNGGQIGTIQASDYWENNIHYLEITLDTYSADWSFIGTYLYVGTEEGYNSYLTLGSDGKYSVNYIAFPFKNSTNSGMHTFKIPYSNITQ